MRKVNLFLLPVFIFLCLGTALAANSAKYVFLFIGDGMGIPQRMAAREFAQGKLMVDRFPAQGITTTSAANRFITGSAAAATAIASGYKTNIGFIGLLPDGNKVPTLAELAKKRGQKVGIISSVSIDHATPAGFYAHVPQRSMYYEIELQLAESGFDFFGGGGFKDPEHKKNNGPRYVGNAYTYAQKQGYKIVKSKKEFLALTPKNNPKILAINPNLPDGKALPYAIDRTQEDISLAEFTEKAIELLDNPRGFFIMVEGGKIDWACHANDATTAIKDTLAFDRAISKAFAFYEQHPQETLIVVTGDHECGGMTLGFAGTKYETYFQLLGRQKISFKKFSDQIVPLFKEKNYSFEQIKPFITEYFGLKFKGNPQQDLLVLLPEEINFLKQAYLKTLNSETSKSKTEYILYGNYDPLTVSITHLLNQKAGIGWTSYKHTGVPVSTAAIGVSAHLFNGSYDNTHIAKKIAQAMGLENFAIPSTKQIFSYAN